ncbi:MAG: TonB-dependent receptor, partial [Bacteroidales bacterium]|nr:TonB-dependent receptor [Bacteroidales bacterium]
IGYVKYQKKINLKSDQNFELNVYLQVSVKDLDEVIVRDKDQREAFLKKLPYLKSTINKIQINESPISDIGDYLRSSPNISGIRKGGCSIDPVIRGFKYSQLNVQVNNGMKIEGGCPNRMDPAVSHIDIEDIEAIEIIKGPYALRYGPSMGGVINLITKKPDFYDKFEIHLNALKGYETNWNGNKEHISVFGGDKHFGFNFSGSNYEYGNYKAGNGEVVNSEFRKYNYKAQIGYSPIKNHSFLFSFEESKGRDVLYPALPMDERTDDTQLMSFDYMASQISKTINSLTFKLYNSDVRHVMDNKNRPFSDTVVAISSINAINKGFRAELGLNIKDSHLFTGIDYENISKDGKRDKYLIIQPNLPEKEEKLWNNALITNLGVFTEYKSSISTFDFIAALRVDFNKANSSEISVPIGGKIYEYYNDSATSELINISFSIGAIKYLNENLSISFALGRGVRSPDMIERYIILLPIGYDKFDYLGDPELNPEINNQIDITLKYSNKKTGFFELNGFYSLVNDFITGKRIPPSQQKPLSKDVLGVKQFYNADKAILKGFEFIYKTPDNKSLEAYLSAAFTYGTISTATKYIMDRYGKVVDDEEINNDALTEIPPFESTIGFFYKFFNGKFTPKCSLRFVAAQHHISEASYEKETPGFIVTNFSFFYKFHKLLNVSAGVNNIFDKAYYEHLNRNIIGSNADFYEPGRIFFVNLILVI